MKTDKQRTKQEIQNEIAALKALKPIGPHAARTKEKIRLSIEELQFGVDDTAGELEELDESEQDIVFNTRDWKQARINDRPSEGWRGLVA